LDEEPKHVEAGWRMNRVMAKGSSEVITWQEKEMAVVGWWWD